MASFDKTKLFPLESLTTDVARSNFNTRNIMSFLSRWDTSESEYETVRLATDSPPYFKDYKISTRLYMRRMTENRKTFDGMPASECFAPDSIYPIAASAGRAQALEYTADATTANPLDETTLAELISIPDSLRIETHSLIAIRDEGVAMYAGKYDSENKWVPDLTSKIDYRNKLLFATRTQNNTFYITLDLSDNRGVFMRSAKPFNISKWAILANLEDFDPSDIMTIRISDGNRYNKWGTWFYPAVLEYDRNAYYEANVYLNDNGVLYRTLFSTPRNTNGTLTDLGDLRRPVFFDYLTERHLYLENDLVLFGDNVYAVTAEIVADAPSPEGDARFAPVAKMWRPNAVYEIGMYVFYRPDAAVKNGGMLYVAKRPADGLALPPSQDADNWEPILLFKTKPFAVTNGSATLRFSPFANVAGIMLRNEGASAIMNDGNISVQASCNMRAPRNVPRLGVGHISTCNYMLYPFDLRQKWKGTDVGPNDEKIKICNRQSYSSVLIFDHGRDDTKTVNYINVDSPDLDQAVCIYLPIESNKFGGYMQEPADGFTFEFFFRIWPVPAYTQASTRDGIINKSQVYVFNAQSVQSVHDDLCGYPIAKFSMARLTNFYTFGENIAVPDKPVYIYAKFVYAHQERQWQLLDMHQLPDHVFIGPVGFVDPVDQKRNIGWETAGFPLFQDAFSDENLAPFRLPPGRALEHCY